MVRPRFVVGTIVVVVATTIDRTHGYSVLPGIGRSHNQLKAVANTQYSRFADCLTMSDDSIAQLYTIPVSNYGTAVKLGMSVKGVRYEEIPPPDGYGSPAYKKIVPMGTCPGFVRDGFVLSESSAILEYLEECYAQPTMPQQSLLFYKDGLGLGSEEVAKRNAAVRFVHRLHDLYLEPPLRALFPHMAPSVRDPALVTEKFALFYRRLADLESARKAIYDQCLQQLSLDQSMRSDDMDQELMNIGPYFFGSQPTLADCVLAPTLQMAEVMSRELTGDPPWSCSYVLTLNPS